MPKNSFMILNTLIMIHGLKSAMNNRSRMKSQHPLDSIRKTRSTGQTYKSWSYYLFMTFSVSFTLFDLTLPCLVLIHYFDSLLYFIWLHLTFNTLYSVIIINLSLTSLCRSQQSYLLHYSFFSSYHLFFLSSDYFSCDFFSITSYFKLMELSFWISFIYFIKLDQTLFRHYQFMTFLVLLIKGSFIFKLSSFKPSS